MKKLVKFGVFPIIFILITGLLFAGGETETKKTVETSIPMIGMVTDVGGLGDGSFNDGCYAGMKQAEEEGIAKINVVESKQMTDYVPNLSGLGEDGAKLVFAVGFLMNDAVIEAATNNPDTMYAGIDLWFDPSTVPANLKGITWKEQEAGYLAGIVAGLMTKEYASSSNKLNNDNVIGAVLGMDIPPVERYFVGYYMGAKSVNPDIKVLSVVTGTFADQAKGKEATYAMVDTGADIVFGIAGLTGLGMINAAQEKGILAIGADVDQNSLAPDTVLTSALKGTTTATYLTIKDLSESNFQGGSNSVYGLKEGAIDIAPFHGFDSIVPAEVKNAVKQAKKKIISGEIVVPSTRKEAGL